MNNNWSSNLNNNGRILKIREIDNVRNLVKRSASQFGLIATTTVPVYSVNSLNLNFLKVRITQLKKARMARYENGQGLQFKNLAKQLGLTLVNI